MAKAESMHILCLGHYPASEEGPFSGPMRVLYNLSEALAKLPKTRVTVMTPHRLRALFAGKTAFGWGKAEAEKISYLHFMLSDLRRFDIINAHGVSRFNALALNQHPHKRVPYVYTAHGVAAKEIDLGYNYSKTKIALERKMILEADCVTTVSDDTRNLITSQYRIEKSSIHVIGNGVDVEDFHVPNGASDQNNRSILFAGDLIHVKGLDFLFESLSLIESPPFELLIAGSPTEYFEGLKKRFKGLFSSGRVKVLGRLSQSALKEVYAKCAFLVLTSRYEQCPQVMTEAMSMGKPVVISDRVGSREMVQDGGGIIVPFGNTERLKNTIIELLNTPELRKRMGKAARSAALAHTWPRVARQYRDLFEKIIG